MGEGGLLLVLATCLVAVLARRWCVVRRRRPAPYQGRLVRLAVAENDLAVERMRDQLAAAGIPCVVRNRDDLSASRGLGFSAPFSRDILVLEGDAPRAAAALDTTSFA